MHLIEEGNFLMVLMVLTPLRMNLHFLYKIFDDNEEDIIEYLDLSTIKRPNLEPKRINIDFPTWMVKKLDEYIEL